MKRCLSIQPPTPAWSETTGPALLPTPLAWCGALQARQPPGRVQAMCLPADSPGTCPLSRPALLLCLSSVLCGSFPCVFYEHLQDEFKHRCNPRSSAECFVKLCSGLWYWSTDAEVKPILEVSPWPLLQIQFLHWVLEPAMACFCRNNWGLAVSNLFPLARGRRLKCAGRWEHQGANRSRQHQPSDESTDWVSAAALKVGVWGEWETRATFSVVAFWWVFLPNFLWTTFCWKCQHSLWEKHFFPHFLGWKTGKRGPAAPLF